MSNKFVVILNGPPNSGKDVGAAHLAAKNIGVKKEFKESLIRIAKSVFSLTDEQWDDLSKRKNKETPSDLLMGMSPRDALIFISEDVVKPAYGDAFFGQRARDSLVDGVNIFSDGGFQEEVAAVVESVGRDNILVVRIHRDGCSFANDSRSYLPDNTCTTVVDLQNNGTLEDFLDTLEHVVCVWRKAC